jgi:adenine-specific DNA-methyltransferase
VRRMTAREPPPSPRRDARPPRARALRGPAPRKPPPALQRTTLWDYPSQHYGDAQQGRQSYRGATPSYVIWNVIERFTSPGELVVDPFAGSGTTLDVARDLGRRARAFDVAPFHADAEVADARRLPLADRSVDLVFMDPPYADNLTYSDDPRCIGRLRGDGPYQAAMREVVGEATRVLRPDGVLAIYVCDVFQRGQPFAALGFDLFAIARAALEPLDVVAVVRHNKQLADRDQLAGAERAGVMLRGFNYLMLFRRPAR